jgi:hypothetical protein
VSRGSHCKCCDLSPNLIIQLTKASLQRTQTDRSDVTLGSWEKPENWAVSTRTYSEYSSPGELCASWGIIIHETQSKTEISLQASTVLNVRGRQFNNLVDVNLSDDEKEISTLPPKSSEPPVSISLKRAFGIKEVRRFEMLSINSLSCVGDMEKCRLIDWLIDWVIEWLIESGESLIDWLID